MIRNVEIFKFSKRPKPLIARNYNALKIKDNYSSERGKKYSQLFIKILNSNKPEKKIQGTKSSKNITQKKNNIKKITLFKPEELTINKYSYNKLNNNNFLKKQNNKSNYNTSKIKENIKKLNKYGYLSNNLSQNKVNKNQIKINKTEEKEKQKEKNKKEKTFGNKNNKENMNNKIKKIRKIIGKNFTDRNLKKKIFKKEKENKRDELFHKNELIKKDVKNNLKIKKVNILNDNDISIDFSKEKCKNDKLNYIFKQKFQKNYEVKIQTLPKLNSVTKNLKSKQNKSNKENRSERIITESLNIIDSFTNNMTLKNIRTIDSDYSKNYYKKIMNSNPKYIHTDISKSLLKSFNNTEMNTMNSTGVIDMQSPFGINNNSFQKLTLDESRKKKKLLINKSESINIKIEQKFDKAFHHNNKISKNLKNLNFHNSNEGKIVKIKVRNIDNICDNNIIQSSKNNQIYLNPQYTDNDINSISYKRKKHYFTLSKNYSIDIENNKNKKRNYRKKHETVKNNIDNIGKKLLILINDFHNKVHQIDDQSFKVHSGKLIDKIRAIKKLNNI